MQWHAAFADTPRNVRSDAVRRPRHDLEAGRAQAHRICIASFRPTEHDAFIERVCCRHSAWLDLACAFLEGNCNRTPSCLPVRLEVRESSPFLPITSPDAPRKWLMRAFAGRSSARERRTILDFSQV